MASTSALSALSSPSSRTSSAMVRRSEAWTSIQARGILDTNRINAYIWIDATWLSDDSVAAV